MENINLSEGEWKIMNVLWENAPVSLSFIVNSLEGETGWTKSTVFVMLKRLISKKAVTVDQSQKIQLYNPIVSKNDCAVRETESFLSKVYNGSIGLMVSSLAGQKALSQSEIENLRRILDEAEKDLNKSKEK